MKGFVRQRGSTYTAYWETKDPATGERRQHTKGGHRTKSAAQKYLNSIIGTVQDGSWKPDQALTVARLLREHWLPAQRAKGLRPTTLAQYKGAVEAWIVPYLASVKVAALTPKIVIDWMDRLRAERRLSPRSVQMTVGFLKAATRYALETALVGRDPLAGVRRPRSQSPERTVWDPEQARAFLGAVRDDRLYAAWCLLLGRGLRRGELAGLRWEAVDLSGGSLAVTSARVVVQGGRVVEGLPKTAAGRRRIDLDTHLVSVLHRHHAQQGEERLRAGEAWADSGYVFTDELGRPYHPDTFSERFERLVRQTGLPRIRLHDLRHSCFSAMAADGTPVKVIQELAGHASPTVTLAIYTHAFPGMGKAAGERLSARLFEGND